jgi:hypothetical protein
MGLQIAEEFCRLTCQGIGTHIQQPPPTKQTIKSSKRTLTLKLWNSLFYRWLLNEKVFFHP